MVEDEYCYGLCEGNCSKNNTPKKGFMKYVWYGVGILFPYAVIDGLICNKSKDLENKVKGEFSVPKTELVYNKLQ